MSVESLDAQNDLKTVLVARFTLCSCDDDHYLPGHPIIDVFPIELRRGNAVAISYAIGDFRRQEFVVGHPYNRPHDPISMSLGVEWSVPDLQARLIELSREHGAVWLDHFSIVQEPENIRIMLGRVPSIYSTFDVVVLLPGSLCTCLADSVREYETRLASDAERLDIFASGIFNCCNAVGFCSYPYRIWTRSEFNYSQSIQAVWTGRAIAPCLKSDEGSELLLTEEGSEESLNAYAREQFLRICEETRTSSLGEQRHPREYAEWRHLESQSDFWKRMDLFVHDYYVRFSTRANTIEPPPFAAANFLLGQRIQRNRPPQEAWEDVLRFTFDIGSLRNSSRVASHDRDYVLAVWPDCPGYKIPDHSSALGLPELLQNAIIQFENLHDESISVQLPAGMFCDELPSGVWRPLTYLPHLSITSANQVYGALLEPCFGISISRDGFIPLKRSRKSGASASRLSHAAEYLSIFGSSSTTEALRFMRRVVADWKYSDAPQINWVSYLLYMDEGLAILKDRSAPPEDDWHHPELGKYVFMEKLFESEYEDSWAGLPEIDHHEIVYELVAHQFNLSVELCKARNLRLIVSRGRSARIGFTKLQDICLNHVVPASQGLSPFKRNLASVRAAFTAPARRRTTEFLSVEINPLNKRTTVYETVKVSDDVIVPSTDPLYQKPVPKYSVVGVWLPSLDESKEGIGAVPDKQPEHGKYDALLV